LAKSPDPAVILVVLLGDVPTFSHPRRNNRTGNHDYKEDGHMRNYRFDLTLKSPDLRRLLRWCDFNLTGAESCTDDVEAAGHINLELDQPLTMGEDPLQFLEKVGNRARDALKTDISIEATWFCYDDIPTDTGSYEVLASEASEIVGEIESYVTDVIYRQRRVLLPKTCPFCQQDLTEPESVRVTEPQVTNSMIRIHPEDEVLDWDDAGADRYGPESNPFILAIHCNRCDYCFGTGAETEVEEDSSFFKGLRSDEEVAKLEE
jgi:hypothetical protein